MDAVDIQHSHNESSRKKQAYTNGYVYVEIHLQIGPIGFLFDTRLYLREKTVRRLNRERLPEKRLRYRSKYALAREMLVELTEMLPKGHKVYVLFGSPGSILSVIQNLVLGLLKRAGFTNSAKGRRWLEGHLKEAFALLTSQNSLS